MDRENRESMEEIHLRILRVTEDLRMIQRELNCAAMQAPTDPELMEALADPPEMEPSRSSSPPSTRCATSSGSTCRSLPATPKWARNSARPCARTLPCQAPEMEQQFQSATDAIMLRYLADSKFRKPN
jgi:hypothetical protein